MKAERQFDDFVPYLMIVFGFWIVCLVEWTQKIVGERPTPGFWMFLSLLVTCYGGVRAFRLYPQFRSAHPGKRRDRRVAEILDRIRSKGFVVCPAPSGNGSSNDYLVVGPGGIYVMEINAWRPIGSRTIDYQTEHEVILGGRITDGRVLRRLRDSALAVHLQLKEQLHEIYSVRPLLVFLGDWHVNRDAGDFAVMVTTADQMEDCFDRAQPELTSKEMAHICSHLKSSARS